MADLVFDLVDLDTSGIRDKLRAELSKRLERARQPVRKKIEPLIASGIMGRKETKSLLDDSLGDVVSLREHLGLSNPQECVEAVIAAIQKSMQVTFVSGVGENLGTFKVEILRGDFEEVLSLDIARYTNEGKSGGVIEWLSWLLFRGSDIILLGSKLVTPERATGYSRTGRPIMVNPNPERKKKHSSGPVGWGLPADFGGHEDDNWLTRALDDVSIPIINVIKDELRGSFLA